MNYFYNHVDKNGTKINEGDFVIEDGKKKKVLRSDQNKLGTDATNPKWIEIGKAFEGEYGVYPFEGKYDYSDGKFYVDVIKV